MDWELPNEQHEPAEEKQVCRNCGNDTFRLYIKIIIDDARMYCAKCGNFISSGIRRAGSSRVSFAQSPNVGFP
jgi:transcription initiation factor TFIIIB Brf1 subunit/transcription initiation factor TFIIB